MTAPQPTYRKDYRPPDFFIDTVDLEFELDPSRTTVTSRMQVRRNPEGGPGPLQLAGSELELVGIELNGEPLDPGRFEVTAEGLSITDFPESAELHTRVHIHPDKNTALAGLYISSGTFCTQCEAEGFRRITFFPDRPDVMSRYTTTLIADGERFPVLLSNGNRVAEDRLPDGRTKVVWEDPFPKPSYLFALVAGDLRAHTGSFTTASGRDVRIEIWVEPDNLDKCEHALASLQRAMRWDEERFGREYDLDLYMIVAVNDFNMGAMENKGLNVFNSKFVLARPDTATDDDFEAIEGVVAHEYFHNWTGNRVTCRDWFQLTLKEGLTVFRDQSFTADMHSAAVKRIGDVRQLRGAQFDEDAGPMAHPIRPESYIEMNNFYTSTVYIKGAEVVRMYETLLGPDGFRRGMDLYFERHDGHAVTCDDFRAAMADANGADLASFESWYEQAGTPVVRAEGRYDAEARVYELTLAQDRPPLNDQPAYRPMPIPVRTALLGRDGAEIPLKMAGEADAPRERVLMLDRSSRAFRFVDVDEPPVPSLLRGFSAPVRLDEQTSDTDLAFRFAHDTDAFNRWDAGQTLAERLLVRSLDLTGGPTDDAFAALFGSVAHVLADDDADPSWRALALQLPSERVLAQRMEPVDPSRIHGAREAARRGIGTRFTSDFERLYELCAARAKGDGGAGYRRLKNAALVYLSVTGRPEVLELVERQFTTAENMTDAQAALQILCDHATPHRERAVASFYDRWRGDALVLDKWFMVQAIGRAPDTLERVQRLGEHPDFTLANPNRARSLIGAFSAANPRYFHDEGGRGYDWTASQIAELDRANPQIAARLASAFNGFARYEPKRRALMRAAIQRLADSNPSRDLFEIVSRALRQ